MTDLETAMKELAEKLKAPRPVYKPDPKQARTMGTAISYPPTVTPYLPGEGKAAVQVHERNGHPAFVKAYERSANPLACPNCQGVGMIVLNLAASGPFKSPPGGVITWFDGNEKYGKGWYVIDKTLAFECPECKGK